MHAGRVLSPLLFPCSTAFHQGSNSAVRSLPPYESLVCPFMEMLVLLLILREVLDRLVVKQGLRLRRLRLAFGFATKIFAFAA